MSTSTPDHRWVDSPAVLDDLIEAILPEPRYALDTEFHRERTYFPRVALVQLAWEGGRAVIDPLELDLRPLGKVLEGEGLAILHAASQDLEVLAAACGAIPSRMFDTQLAAGFLGHSTPSLANLLAAELGVRVPKAERLTDWLRRPLTEAQKAYAIADVEHLLALHDVLVAQLTERGRLDWALDECEELRTRPTGPGDPDLAWLRLKDARHLRGRSRGVAQALAAWRERRAIAADIPARFVVPDLALLGMAQRPPRTADDLRTIRGLDERHTRGALAGELLEVVRAGGDTEPAAARETRPDEIDRRLRPAVTLVSAWLSQHARNVDIDVGLLATRGDIVDLLAGAGDARLATGWRADLVGDAIGRLVRGEAALAFDADGGGGLRLLNLD